MIPRTLADVAALVADGGRAASLDAGLPAGD